MVWGGDVNSATHATSRSNVDLVIGCLIDLATGLVTFTVNGKEITTSYQVLVCLRDYDFFHVTNTPCNSISVLKINYLKS